MTPFQNSLNNTNTGDIVTVFLLTGQSNSYGLATGGTTTELQEKTNFKIWSKINSQFENMDIGVNNLGSTHGIELGLADLFDSYYSGETGYLIKLGVPSTGILTHLSQGTNYNEFWNYFVKPAINTLLSEGKRCRIKMIFSQGEWDANTDNEPLGYLDYGTNFDEWVTLWQTNFSTDLSIANYEVLSALAIRGPEYEWEVINQVFTDKSLTESEYQVMNTKDLTNIGDNLHYDYTAHKAIAKLALDYFAVHQGHLQTNLL